MWYSDKLSLTDFPSLKDPLIHAADCSDATPTLSLTLHDYVFIKSYY